MRVITYAYSINVDICRNHCYYQRNHWVDFKDYKENEKRRVIVVSYAIVNYDTMMIEAFNALAASHAMNGSRRP